MATRGRFAALGDKSGQEGRQRPREIIMAVTLTPGLVSLAHAADALAVSTRTVRRYISDGQLDAVRLGRKTLRIKV